MQQSLFGAEEVGEFAWIGIPRGGGQMHLFESQSAARSVCGAVSVRRNLYGERIVITRGRKSQVTCSRCVPGAHPKQTCTPDKVGSGPVGKTCGDCQHLARVSGGNATYLKCGRVEPSWTHGPGSDIRASWAACSKFEDADS